MKDWVHTSGTRFEVIFNFLLKKETENLIAVWNVILNIIFQFLNNIIYIFIHFLHTHIFKKYKQTYT